MPGRAISTLRRDGTYTNMNISGIPRNILKANTSVVQELRAASQTLKGISASSKNLSQQIDGVLEAVSSARIGAANLGPGSVLDGAFGRWAFHAERDLQRAAQLAQGPKRMRADTAALFNSHITAARDDLRFALAAGDRSIKNPSKQVAARVTSFAETSSGSTSQGPVWVDGAWVDDLGNTPRTPGGTWSGPDGQLFGGDGTPVGYGSGNVVYGPDGPTYGGI